MFSTTLKQSVATLGVVAGMLAAAGPASAQILDGPVLAKAWTDGNNQPWDGSSYRQGATLGTQVGSEGVKDDVPLETVSFTIRGAAFRGEVIGLEPTVKAPASGGRCR